MTLNRHCLWGSEKPIGELRQNPLVHNSQIQPYQSIPYSDPFAEMHDVHRVVFTECRTCLKIRMNWRVLKVGLSSRVMELVNY